MTVTLVVVALSALAALGVAPVSVLAATHKPIASSTARATPAAAATRPARRRELPDAKVRAGIIPPNNPASNIAAVPRLAGALCTSTTTGSGTTYRCDNPCADAKAVLAGQPPGLNASPVCTQAAVAAIDRARAIEHVAPLVLPTNWSSLDVPEQLFVITDLERVDRGIPPLVGLVPSLDAAAGLGAREVRDPSITLSASMPGPETSNWSGNDYSVLISDYEWMYQDGWGPGNGNLDCTSPRAGGCWGHRDNVLGQATGTSCSMCMMGAGFASDVDGWGTSFTELFLRPGASSLQPTFTWAKDVLPELPGH